MSGGRELDGFVERARWLSRRDDLESATAEVLETFSRRGVEALVLKGPAVASAVYTAKEVRTYFDIDLLVSPETFPGARQALAEVGFKHVEFDLVAVADPHAETWSRPRGGPGGPLVVDLHWRIAGCGSPPEAAWRAFNQRRSWLDLEWGRIPVLNSSGLAFHLAAHAAQLGADDEKALADLARGVERLPDDAWRDAAVLAEEVGAIPAFAAGLRLVPAGAELAESLDLPPTPALSWALSDPGARPPGTARLEAMQSADGLAGRARIVRRSLFPSRDWISVHFPWAGRSHARMAAAYALHVLRTPVWALRAWHYRRRWRKLAR